MKAEDSYWRVRGGFMVQFDNRNRLMKIKIVYYGPALGGKTTSLQWIHQRVDPERRTRLYSLNTANDRTLFFDLMSLRLGRFREHDLSLQLYTVPGQVQYNATRRAVLTGADGVVFVADSQKKMLEANCESLDNLVENLEANGIPSSIPLVFQYNKQDLPDLSSMSELRAKLNQRDLPAFQTTATTGQGVMEAFAAIVEQSMAEALVHLGAGDSEKTRIMIRRRVQESFENSLPRQEDSPESRRTVIEHEPSGEEEVLGKSQLIVQAVRANVQLSELNDEMEELQQKLRCRVAVLEAGVGFAQEISSSLRATDVLNRLLDAALIHLSADAGGVFLNRGAGLEEFSLRELGRDPLLAGCESLVMETLKLKQSRLVFAEPGAPGFTPEEEILVGQQFSSALLIPLVIQDRSRALLSLYRKEHRLPFGQEELQLGVMMAQHAGAAFSNISNWTKLKKKNRSLEEQVAERTSELRESLAEIQGLHGRLAEEHEALEETYSRLAEVDQLKQDILTRVSHELRTPVSSILTAATILSDESESIDGELARFVCVIHDEAEHMAELIAGILHATEILSWTECPPKQALDPRQFCKNALQSLQQIVKNRRITLKFGVSRAVETIFGDPESLSMAMQAVFKNALLFSPEDEFVEIRVLREESEGKARTVIRVDDSGPGIPPEDWERVFEAFRQGGDLMTGKPPGVGLGLTIARRVLDLHGGRIRIGASPTGGARVELLIPESSTQEE